MNAIRTGVVALGILLAAAGTGAIFGQADFEKTKEPPVMRETGEPEGDAFHLPAVPVDPRVYDLQNPAITHLARRIEDGSAGMIERRAWWWLEQRLAPFETMPPADWRIKAQSAIRALETERARRNEGAPEATTLTWAPMGPAVFPNYDSINSSGRATALWVDPSDKNVILLGTADGGVWKTTNQGTTWAQIFDTAASQSIGSIAVDPNNKQVIYVGTGEGNFCIDGIGGTGIYKSTNGGASWSLLSGTGTSNTSFRRIAVDPLDSNKVYAAGYNLYYSINGGSSWSTTACGASSGNYYFTDVVLDSANGSGSTSIVYAAIGYYGSMSSNGVYRSTGGGGGTWTKISTGTGFPTSNVGRITLLMAPSAPKQIYALVQSTSTYASLGIFLTSDATAASVTWTAKSTTSYCSTQCWYDMTGAVNPTDPARLVVGGLDNYLSTNSAGTLTQISHWNYGDSTYSHADHHHMVMPDATTLYDANDGGFFIGTINWTSPASTTWTNKNAGLNTLQFYGFAQHPTDATKVQGGLQDNGQYYYNGTSWLEVEGGDGGASAWDQGNGSYAYEEYVYAGIERNSNMTGTPSSWTCIQNINGCSGCSGGCTPDGRCAFIAPFVLDANNQNTMYTGTYRIWKNAAPRTGSTWSSISTDITGGSGYVTAIHSARNNGTTGTIYAGTSSGKAYMTTDGGTNWNNRSTGLSGASVTSFTTDPADGLKVLATVSGYGAPHIYRSTTGGASWTNITGSLPAHPFNTIILDSADANHAYAGSDFGIFENTAVWTGSTWTSITSNLPAVSVQQLGKVTGGKLRAATHGRGIWELTVSATTPKEASPSKNMTATRGAGTSLTVSFASGCGATDNTVYAGNLATLGSSGVAWTSRFCNKGTSSPITFDPGAGNVYFVVVSNEGSLEGSYGQGSTGERPAAGAGSPCAYTQNLTGTCP
jgi:hypothetical protein